MPRLKKEDVAAIQVLKQKGQSASAIARTLGVTEGAVRYRVKRAEAGAADGRSRQVHVWRWTARARRSRTSGCRSRPRRSATS